ncbi:hypothetical protein C8J56DRAFT_1061904 [Mycena floridula]|nr:hypothetical protein C8J56DRAFT_1061904 [Mycena floridula]
MELIDSIDAFIECLLNGSIHYLDRETIPLSTAIVIVAIISNPECLSHFDASRTSSLLGVSPAPPRGNDSIGDIETMSGYSTAFCTNSESVSNELENTRDGKEKG